MDLQTRKLNLIQQFLMIDNESLINELEQILYSKKYQKEIENINPMTLEQLNNVIDQAEDDSENNRLINANELLKQIDEWK